ncbi:nucleoside-diphosphate sugar epimerase/dehydratase [uncultured Draconibacterium sp.]|uniref:polysaccharide biosynthesis protein n=1 Tax=uncultured Draconibacterium sp. TaxID=1573823 RepID=UPI0029C74AEC|nr:nucleoside-diphosphate sugar epimerase/dehydratase [uncultured Draconibacterium sp.]
MKSFKRYFTRHYLPRWAILLFDIGIATFSWFSAFILRLNFNLSGVDEVINPWHLSVVLPIFIVCCWITNCYSVIMRHTTIKDIKNIILSVPFTGATLIIISLTIRQLNTSSFVNMPISVIVIFVLLTTTFMVMSRLFAKILYQHWIIQKKDTKKVLIFGTGELGQTTLNALSSNNMQIKAIGFIDENAFMHNKFLSGYPIYSTDKALKQVIPKNNVTEIIFAIEKSELSYQRKRQITDQFLKLHLLVKEVPPIESWINGKLQANAIHTINIEDLLGRNSIQLDRERIKNGLKNSVVLVTGAAGSIGSEIVRQLISFGVQRVILLDRAESDIYNLQQEIIANNPSTNFDAIVGDVTNVIKMRSIFQKYSPTIVFSAAAYKHVPLMEKFPSEAIHVNLGGNKIMADLSAEFGVEKFVMISTDKAVNPTNVMGATKRLCEMYIQALAQSEKYKTQFIITRFGNVLGSNGSVVPLFKKQIERGGPVTITHENITRYFMTIPEACQLVLEAGFIGKGGEIFVFDMGEPVKIIDLARKMISLSGFIPDEDIMIKITGLRPGEKLYEELLDEKEEKLDHTHNSKIMIGKDRKHDLTSLNQAIIHLLNSISIMSRQQIVDELMRLIPEYVSMNSYYRKSNDSKVFMQFDQLYKEKNKEKTTKIQQLKHNSKNGKKFLLTKGKR